MTHHPFHSFDTTGYIRINGNTHVSTPHQLLHASEGIQIFRRLNDAINLDALDFLISGQSKVNVSVDQHHPDAQVTQTLIVRINDEHGFIVRPASNAQVMTFITGDENDEIGLGPHILNPCVVHAGGGDDEIDSSAHHASIYGGEGDDHIVVVEGNCYADGEEGNDMLYSLNNSHVTFHGGPGNDTLEGSRHTALSFLDGGEGDDTLIGGGGPNILVGGPGDDRIGAGDQHNVIYTGEGYNQVENLKPTDTTHHNVKSDLTVDCTKISPEELDKFPPGTLASHAIHVEPRPLNPAAFILNGSAHFVERAKDDLRLLLASPTGQKLLSELENAALASGKPIEINELLTDTDAHFIAGDTVGAANAFINNGQAGTPCYGGIVSYSIQDVMGDKPSVVALFHELCHAYNYVTGTLLPGLSPQSRGGLLPPKYVPNTELQAVGLPTNAAPFDFDGDASTPATNTNPVAFSENGLRQELGLPPRTRY
ncbi:M91 family zinc metallopeptidase [Pseudomonas costantinii]|uniref:M91 family zinc metallopeptidase n=1 Tax=Pseudomonas costantinii TaxID=168469 RepID=UPI0015A30639|nr:M91 family zinc metallopeptidase [Pseudomonas costantinii]NVZ70134.1 hypothetical protein [Pseudomonas costantinii]